MYHEDTFFGWYIDDFWLSSILLLTVDILIQQQDYFMQGFCIILCCHIFKTMSTIIKKFQQKLYARNFDSLSDYLEYFTKLSKEIHLCMEEMEASLSLLLTLLYGFMVWNIFNVLTLLTQLDVKAVFTMEDEMEWMNNTVDILSLSFTVLSFMIVSFRAATINDSAILVQNTVFQTVAIMTSPDQQEGNLLIKMATDFASKMAITGSQLFTIKRSIVLKIMSVLLSYSILITQLGQWKKKSEIRCLTKITYFFFRLPKFLYSSFRMFSLK